MKWLDSCMFNGELVMKLRLQYLSPYVDKFYICEKRYTYQGHRKEKLYKDIYRDWFEPYLTKIVFLVDESIPTGTNPWAIETYHRNYVMPWLLAEEGPWICSVCDVDEIPDVKAVLQEKAAIYLNCSKGAVYMQQPMFYYNLNWYVEEWRRAFFVSNTLLTSASKSLQQYRDKQDIQIGGLLQCGWHLSYCMSAEEIQRKLQSFAHTEYSGSEYTSLEHIRNCLLNGRDLFRRYPTAFTKTNLTVFPPEFQTFHSDLLRLQMGDSSSSDSIQDT